MNLVQGLCVLLNQYLFLCKLSMCSLLSFLVIFQFNINILCWSSVVMSCQQQQKPKDVVVLLSWIFKNKKTTKCCSSVVMSCQQQQKQQYLPSKNKVLSLFCCPLFYEFNKWYLDFCWSQIHNFHFCYVILNHWCFMNCHDLKKKNQTYIFINKYLSINQN